MKISLNVWILDTYVYSFVTVAGRKQPCLLTWMETTCGFSVRISCHSDLCQNNFDAVITFRNFSRWWVLRNAVWLDRHIFWKFVHKRVQAITEIYHFASYLGNVLRVPHKFRIINYVNISSPKKSFKIVYNFWILVYNEEFNLV